MSGLILIDNEIKLIIPRLELRAVWLEKVYGGSGATLEIRHRKLKPSEDGNFYLVIYVLSTIKEQLAIECWDARNAELVLRWFDELIGGSGGVGRSVNGRWELINR